MAKQPGKRKKDGAKADATEGLPPLNLHENKYREQQLPRIAKQAAALRMQIIPLTRLAS